jgi:hypothetical protein
MKEKKAGCTSCKKKKPITELPPVMDEMEVVYVPTPEEIRLAYIELGNKDIQKVQPLINKVYNALFGEDFNFNCAGCFNSQAHKLKIYIAENLR